MPRLNLAQQAELSRKVEELKKEKKAFNDKNVEYKGWKIRYIQQRC